MKKNLKCINWKQKMKSRVPSGQKMNGTSKIQFDDIRVLEEGDTEKLSVRFYKDLCNFTSSDMKGVRVFPEFRLVSRRWKSHLQLRNNGGGSGETPSTKSENFHKKMHF